MNPDAEKVCTDCPWEDLPEGHKVKDHPTLEDISKVLQEAVPGYSPTRVHLVSLFYSLLDRAKAELTPEEHQHFLWMVAKEGQYFLGVLLGHIKEG